MDAAFSQGLFGLCLLVIFAALACLTQAALQVARAPDRAWAWLPLSLHAGWLSLAAFLNLYYRRDWPTAGPTRPRSSRQACCCSCSRR